jgi:hypothetical protein
LAQSLCLIILGFGLCLPAQAADFSAVEKWRLSFNYRAQKTVKTEQAQWTYSVTAVADFVLDERKQTDDQWYGHPSTTVTLNLTGSTSAGCPVTQTVEYTGPARRQEEPDATLYAGEEGFFIQMGNPWVEATVTTEWDCPGMSPRVVETEPRMFTSEWTDPIPYPADGLTLSGVLERSEYIDPIIPMVSANEPVDVTMRFTLTPYEEGDLVLDIEPSEAYANWRPTADDEGGDGEPVEFTATLRSADGSPPREKMKQLEWELIETSREPGFTINWPPQPAANDPDLHFGDVPAQGPGVTRETVGEDKLKVVATFTAGDGTSDTIKVYPRDWGGWSTLRATAILENGKRVQGRLVGAAEEGVRLPDRDPGRFIARAWLEQRGISDADRSDLDDQPKGDSHPGDGLTLYEEYRGFHVDGRRVEGDPERKELFVVNEGGAPGAGGVQLFRRLTGLRVHGQLRKDEMDDKRVVNHNASASPRLGPQHAVWIKVEEKRKGAAEAVNASGRPSTPGGVEYIGLPVSFPWRPTTSPSVSYDTITVAHELLHAVNVYHHGESDEVVFWSRDPDGKMYEQATVEQKEEYVPVGPRSEIRAFLEDGRDVTHQTRVGLRHLGTQHGQHSGAENCVMRYDIADSYVSLANPTHRYVGIKEIQGAQLDNSSHGQDVNLPTRLPQPRYGSAAQGRGVCQAQILVSDAIKPPAR